MSTDCTTTSISLASRRRQKLLLEFDGGKITSDAGARLLREADRRLNLVKRPVTAEEERKRRGTKIHRHQRCNAPAGASLETAGVVPSTVNGENNGNPCIYRGFLLFVRGTTG